MIDWFCKRCFPIAEKKKFQAFKASNWLARAGQCAAVLRSMSLQSGFRYKLLNPPLQPLESTTHVLTVIVAQKLINHVLMQSRENILLCCRQELSGGVNNA